MTGSAEVKAALAFARAMRRPAESLMALLERTDRMTAALRDAPVLAVPDPTGLLAALLATGNDAVRQRATPQKARSLSAPSGQARSGRRGVQPAVAQPAAGPAGIVSASRDGGAQSASAPTAPIVPARVGAEGLGSLRDALRQAAGRGGSADLRGTSTAHEPDNSTSRARGRSASSNQPVTETPRTRPASTEPAAIRPASTLRGTEHAGEQGGYPQSALSGPSAPASGAFGSALAGLLDGIGAATRDQSVATGGTAQRSTRAGTPEQATIAPGTSRGGDPPQAAAPGGSPPAPLPSSGQASTPIRIQELPVTTGKPAAKPPERPGRPVLNRDDNPTALAEAAWRHGVDLS